MIVVTVLTLAAQAATATSPVVVVDTPLQAGPVGETSWTCEAMVAGQKTNLSIAGRFPSVSVEAQQNGEAHRLQATMKSAADQRFNGEFPSALIANAPIVKIRNYSVMIPGQQVGRPNFILAFAFYGASEGGTVNVLQFDSSGKPSAYAAGLCQVQVSK